MGWTKNELLVKPSGKYPIYTITNKNIQDMRSVCKGFVRGGTVRNLEEILSNGMIQCTNDRPDDEFANDRNSNYPGADAVYFRFAIYREVGLIPKCVGGVGSSGGMIFYMPIDKAVGQRVVCFCEHDTSTDKFSNTTQKTGVKDGRIEKVIPKTREEVSKNLIATAIQSTKVLHGMQSEIGFYKNVSLDLIQWIFIKDKKNYFLGHSPNWNYYGQIIVETWTKHRVIYQAYLNRRFPAVSAVASSASKPAVSASSNG